MPAKKVNRRADPGQFRPMIDSFALSLRASGTSTRTIEMYVDAAVFLAGWLREHHPDTQGWADVGRDQLRGHWAWLFDQGYAKSYVNNLGRCHQQFFRWHSSEERLPNPFLELKPPAPPKLGEKQVPVLTPEQLGALIRDAERGRDFVSRRDAAIMRLFACTGVRLAELAGMEVDDIRLQVREALVTGKGSKQRTVKFDHKAALAVDRYLRLRARRKIVLDSAPVALWIGAGLDGRMLPNGIYQMIKRRGVRHGVEVYPHMFRHTFSHNWLFAGGAEGDLMQLNGWDSPQMLRHYGASARSARARRAYDRIDVMSGV